MRYPLLACVLSRNAIILSVVVLIPCVSVRAQGTDASIRGQISDSGGAPIVAATVEVRNIPSGFVTQVRSSDRGRYVAAQLPLGGPYRVTIRAVGYGAISREILTLNIGSIVTADFRLSTRRVQLQDVVVSADPSRTIERNGAVTRIGEQQVRELPTPDKADVVLQALIDMREKSVVASTSAAQVREFQLRLKFHFRATTPSGRELIPRVELLLTRDLSYTEVQALAKENEEAELYRAMTDDVVAQVLRRLAAVQV